MVPALGIRWGEGWGVRYGHLLGHGRDRVHGRGPCNKKQKGGDDGLQRKREGGATHSGAVASNATRRPCLPPPSIIPSPGGEGSAHHGWGIYHIGTGCPLAGGRHGAREQQGDSPLQSLCCRRGCAACEARPGRLAECGDPPPLPPTGFGTPWLRWEGIWTRPPKQQDRGAAPGPGQPQGRSAQLWV